MSQISIPCFDNMDTLLTEYATETFLETAAEHHAPCDDWSCSCAELQRKYGVKRHHWGKLRWNKCAQEWWMSRKCRPVDNVSHPIAKQKKYRIDLLQIDTEGYDWEVLRTMSFRNVRPRVIVYEEKM